MSRFHELVLTRAQAWWLLSVTIGSEVSATLLLKVSDGFTRPLPSAASVLGFVIAVVLFAKVLEVIATSVASTVWNGVGAALVVVVGILAFDEVATLRAVVGIILVIGGVVVLNHSGTTPAAPPL